MKFEQSDEEIDNSDEYSDEEEEMDDDEENNDINSDTDTSSDGESGNNYNKINQIDETKPLYMLLEERETATIQSALDGKNIKSLKNKRKNSGSNISKNHQYFEYNNDQTQSNSKNSNRDKDRDDDKKKVKNRANKHAPAVVSSKKPPKRMKLSDETSTELLSGSLDPRFTEYTGKLDNHQFMKDYNFLDERQQEELNRLKKVIKKKGKHMNSNKLEELRDTLIKGRQQMSERHRAQRQKEKLDTLYKNEKDKVKAGKTPYFMKKSAVKQVLLEDRYDELKKSRKLKTFMERKRKKSFAKTKDFLEN